MPWIRTSRLRPAIITAIVVIPLYPLSVGPAVQVLYAVPAAKTSSTWDTMETIYWPVARIYWRAPLLRPAMDVYVRYWGVKCSTIGFWMRLDMRGSLWRCCYAGS